MAWGSTLSRTAEAPTLAPRGRAVGVLDHEEARLEVCDGGEEGVVVAGVWI